jgi:hypothetical protein
MASRIVKAYPWRCPRCVHEQELSPDIEFKIRTLATTQILTDGSRRTIVWRRRHGGTQSALALFAAALARNPNVEVVYTSQLAPRRRSREPARWIGTILGPDDEVRVPCGRHHPGGPGSELISDRRFIQQLKRIAG